MYVCQASVWYMCQASVWYMCQASVWYMCQASVWYKHDDTALITVNILKICFIGIHES